MTIELYANNAKTTLAAPITSSQTTITVAPGTGALFPNPSAGQVFRLTLNSVSSPSIYEICICTARSGDTLTVIRAQEGTTGEPFLLNDIAGNFDTANVMANLVQSAQLQNDYYGFAVATGTANAITATFPSVLTAVSDGMAFTVKTGFANTGPATLTLVLGSTVVGSFAIVKGNNAPLVAGDIPGAGYPLLVTYSSTYNAFVVIDTVVNLTPYAPLDSPALTGTPTAPTPSTGDASAKLATTQYVQNVVAQYMPLNQMAGVILMWSGSIASIPYGWSLCDGGGGRPDLRDKFIVGAGSTYAPAATGGSKDAVVVSHTHTAVVTDPGHNHTHIVSGGEAGYSPNQSVGTINSGSASATSTSTTGISVTNSPAGSSGTNANLPPYFALAYIIKL